jgi:hypothetical protein
VLEITRARMSAADALTGSMPATEAATADKTSIFFMVSTSFQ